jgi:hypothetical protein
MLDVMIQRAGGDGVKDIVIGMAHRGRLNVLVNTLGKPPRKLFDEFEGKFEHSRAGDHAHTGDVKYHMGFSADIATPGGPVHLALAFNPSHLEIVDPVVVGSVRSRQLRRGDKERKQVLPILLHGDAAFAGQGVVMELFQMSQARGFRVGGTVHVVINNQVGFTTSAAEDARSTLYCTDVAKMIGAPILHVNGDDPEAVAFVSEMAFDFRQRFGKDVVIDLVCYRRHGHNEADEPAATQPLMYQKIRAMKTTRELYAARLDGEGSVPAAASQALVDGYRNTLDAGDVTTDVVQVKADEFTIDWSPYLSAKLSDPVDTRVERARPWMHWRPASTQSRTRSSCTRAWPRSTRTAARWRPANCRRLGLRREPGLRDAGERGLSPAPGRPGLRPRHVLPSPRDPARPVHGQLLPAAARTAEGHAGPQPGRRDHHRLAAQRGGGDGVRVRLRDRRPDDAGHLGRPVRRFRQRRPGRHRPVPLLRRSQVGPPVRPGAVPAARLRRPGPGTQLGAP